MTPRMYITKTLREWKADAGVTHTILWREKNHTLTIYTDRPGPLIGLMGERVFRFTEKLRKYDKTLQVVFEETEGIA